MNKDKLNVLYCYTHVGHLGAAACVVLAGQWGMTANRRSRSACSPSTLNFDTLSVI